ncbi:hypothetical protein AB664_03955 [Brucella anthropi]|uniref:Uncharacterized protein n=1 Tax=Brucella anthropi TaxID=529 RepID=A0A656Z5S6_BRUAN|nr:hypothetical protein AB664_03955 [Brucella anthropi]
MIEFPPDLHVRNGAPPEVTFCRKPLPAIVSPDRSPAMATLHDIGGVGPKRDRASRHGGAIQFIAFSTARTSKLLLDMPGALPDAAYR